MARLASLIWAFGLFASEGCRFNESVSPETNIFCAGNADCPQGFVCKTTASRCVKENTTDTSPPALLNTVMVARYIRRGAPIMLTAATNEPLRRAIGFVQQAGRRRALTTVVDGASVSVAGRAEADDVEGPARILLSLVDTAENETSELPVASFDFDFTPPEVASVNVLAPRSAIAGMVAVRPDEAISVRVLMNEVVTGQPALQGVSPTCSQPSLRPFSPTAAVGAVLDFESPVPGGQTGCQYGLQLGAISDLAGNVTSEQVLATSYVVDGEAPQVSALQTGYSLPDGGLTVAATFSAQPGFNQLRVRFRVTGQLSRLTTRLDDGELAGCRLENCAVTADEASCACSADVTLDRGEGAHIISIDARDLAGNVRATSTQVVYDFTGPQIVAGTSGTSVLPPANCLLGQVTDATVGSTIRFFFAVNEPLRGTPTLSSSPASLGWAVPTQTANTWSSQATVTTGAIVGAQRFLLSLTDTLGNTAAVDIDAGYRIQITTPPAPPTQGDGGVWYEQQPWGVDGGPPIFSVKGARGAVPAGTTVLVLDGPNANSLELGRAQAEADGRVNVSLTRGDRSVVYVSSLDSACNRSASFDVKQVHWYASLGGKVAGSQVENPHQYEERRTFRYTLNDPDATEPSRVTAVLANESDRLETVAGYRWENQARVRSPSLGFTGGIAPYWYYTPLMLAFDSLRQAIIATDGKGTVWEWREPQWILLTEGNLSESRVAFAFDSRRNRAIAVGFVLSGNTATFTWEWDGAAWSVRATTGLPSLLGGPGIGTPGGQLVYDAERGVTLLRANSDQRVYEWNGSEWTRSAAPGYPTGTKVSAAYDPVRRYVVFIDGTTGSTYALSATGWVC